MREATDHLDEWRNLKRMMKALAGIARLTIIYHLAHQPEITVTALTDMLNISQPLVSWHLRKLKRAGLIETRRAGRQVYCSLNVARFQLCIQRLGSLVDPAMQVDTLPSGVGLIEAEAGTED
jgi:ArsR family transcriptional regulator